MKTGDVWSIPGHPNSEMNDLLRDNLHRLQRAFAGLHGVTLNPHQDSFVIVTAIHMVYGPIACAVRLDDPDERLLQVRKGFCAVYTNGPWPRALADTSTRSDEPPAVEIPPRGEPGSPFSGRHPQETG